MLTRVPGRIFGQVVLSLALTLPATAFATLLSLSDPLGDAVGDGSLAAPTAERFGGGAFDILSITVLDSETFTFRLELAEAGSRADDGAGTGAQAITEVYLDSEPGGAPALLPGSGMQLPNGGWEVAFQIIGERLRVFRPDEAGVSAEATRALNARLVREGNALLVTTSLKTPRRFSLYGLVGSYDPFSEKRLAERLPRTCTLALLEPHPDSPRPRHHRGRLRASGQSGQQRRPPRDSHLVSAGTLAPHRCHRRTLRAVRGRAPPLRAGAKRRVRSVAESTFRRFRHPARPAYHLLRRTRGGRTGTDFAQHRLRDVAEGGVARACGETLQAGRGQNGRR